MSLLGSNTTVDARVGRKTNNALTLTFRSGPGEPFAVATQGGSKLGILLGFKNGAPGLHTVVDGAKQMALAVDSKRGEPTPVTDGAGRPVGSIVVSDHAALLDADGHEVGRLVDAPEGHRPAEAFVLAILGPSGDRVGTFAIAQTVAAWKLFDDLWQTAIWWDRAGQPLKLPFLGILINLTEPVGPVLGDLLVAAAVDVGIGIHGYTPSVRGERAAR